MTTPRHDEQYRRECEARFWLEQTGGRKGEIDELLARIVKRRGRQAAEQLREDMRAEWIKARGRGQ